MKTQKFERSGWVLPVPGFIFKPLTAAIISAVHIYLAAGHLYQLFSGEITWTNIWKGFGALGGAYVFAALASRQFDRRQRESKNVEPVYAENGETLILEA
jgi:membrane associated rhomboid family serine protease